MMFTWLRLMIVNLVNRNKCRNRKAAQDINVNVIV